MKYIHERHTYAPEMNKIHFLKGGEILVSGITSLKEVREKLFKPRKKGLYCVCESVYDSSEWRSLHRVVASGYCNSRKEALDFCNSKFKQAGGPLIDGSVLPPNKLKFTFKYF